ncbi:MAG: cyclic nucleotide-binding domain-containing protein [Planctomycetales bacterium]|nr:cyclic nucleotide-binding domain-containing protein [Planctomycetales bacterium]
MAEVQANLPVDFKLRPGDERLTAEELAACSLFTGLKKLPPFKKLPGSVVLRRFRAGEVVCEQGEAGATAFYILRPDDIVRLRESQFAAVTQVLDTRRRGELTDELDRRFRDQLTADLERRASDLWREVDSISRQTPRVPLPPEGEGTVSAQPVVTAKLLVDLEGGRRRSLLSRLVGLFRGKSVREPLPESIPIDGPTDIDTKSLTAKMYAGELFGEMSCVNRAPRSATIVVDQDCYLLELLRNVLDILHGDAGYQQRMDDVYRRRVLESHLRRLSIFRELSDAEFARLKQSVELVEFKSGATIFEEGQPSDCFYVIRSGLVKVVANATTGMRRTLAYLGRGDFIGEIGVMLDKPRSATCIAFDHPDSGQEHASEKRGAVPSRVELVKIRADVFRELVRSSSNLSRRVDTVIATRQARSASAMKKSVADLAHVASQTPEFEQLGLVQGQRLMLIDLDSCTRCGACVDACVSAHDDGRTRLYLDGPRFEGYLVPLTCRSCLDPVCMIGCPVGAINRGENGEIRIADWCIGCELCANQCPYGSIQMNSLVKPLELTDLPQLKLDSLEAGATLKPVSQQAVVCDLCSSTWSGSPACVYACPHDAAHRVNAREFFVKTER